MNTEFGSRTIVWRLHSSIRCSFSRVLMPSPNSVPSGSTTAARPPGFRSRMIRARNRSAVSLRAEMCGKLILDAVLFAAAEGRIGQHDVNPLVFAPADVGPGQRVVVAHEAWVLDAMQQHVRDAKHVRKLFFLDGSQSRLHLRFIFRPLHIALAHVADGTGEKAAGTACGIEEDFAGLGIDPVRHEGGDGARCVIFAGIARRLQVVEHLLVDVAEMLALAQIVEVDAVDLVDHLPHQLTGFHVVVGVFKHVPDDAAAVAGLWPMSGSPFSAGNSSPLTKASKASPVMPSGSAAQVRH